MQKPIIFFLALISLLQMACDKDDAQANDSDIDNRISNVIADNKFNFSLFNTMVNMTNTSNLLLEEGPFTVLLPDNTAFENAGYYNEESIRVTDPSLLNNMMQYYILEGKWELNKLAYRFNQDIPTHSGATIFVSHWIKDGDTVLTVNGTRVVALNLPASNGLIQVLNAVPAPAVHNNLSDAIAADPTLTFLNMALQQAGMKTLLAGPGPYSMFAPSNNAFLEMGFPNIDSVGRTDPEELRKILRYHIFTSRRFTYDYVLSTGNTNLSEQAMLNGNNVTVQVSPPGDYITLQGPGNTAPISLVKKNVLTGNGVLHTIDNMLKENF
jgi:uncharacterized surface protein with fasciclin (FAS1) repeats